MRIDCHIHLIGTGTSGTGCWYRPRGFTRLGEPFLARAIGISTRDLRGLDFDRLYVQRLLALVRESTSIDRAMLLAHELPHREDGTPIPEKASLYVPNHYVLETARTHPEFLPAVSIHPARKGFRCRTCSCLFLV